MILATSEQQQRVIEIGRTVVDLVDAFVSAELGAEAASDEERSAEFGRRLLFAVLMAGNDIAWMNRFNVIEGLGLALGDLMVAHPEAAHAIEVFMTRGVRRGHAEMTAALTPQGRA